MRQPNASVTKATSGAAIRIPPGVPAANRPVATDRSAAGNHSDTPRIAPGTTPASPRPSRKRQTASPAKPVTSPCRSAAADQNTAQAASATRVPRRSTMWPLSVWLMV